MPIHRHLNQVTLNAIPDMGSTNPIEQFNAYLYYINATTIRLNGLNGTPENINVNGDWVDITSPKSLTTSTNVIVNSSGTITEGSTPSASTAYYVYLANNDSDWNFSGGTDYRNSMFLCTSAPTSDEYLYATGQGAEARALGYLYLNSSTQLSGRLAIASRHHELTNIYVDKGTGGILTVSSTTWVSLGGVSADVILLPQWTMHIRTFLTATGTNIAREARHRILGNTIVLETGPNINIGVPNYWRINHWDALPIVNTTGNPVAVNLTMEVSNDGTASTSFYQNESGLTVTRFPRRI